MQTQQSLHPPLPKTCTSCHFVAGSTVLSTANPLGLL
uniref:Uncharacterized protein n=1 Tax=Anguilla anguilla TaxID=7936 RepID=A0A0E9RND4_ANGAN